jgi:hypothetical protein
MNEAIQIICVVSNFEVFESMIAKNPFMNGFPIQAYDNTVENIGIPRRYNHFIEQHMNDDAWLVFCHQDFGFSDDPYLRIKDLDRTGIYGPIGAARRKGLFIRQGKIALSKKVLLGQIDQARNDNNFFRHGIYLDRPRIVDTVDCCCLIVHSSLIKKYELRFDENLDFHLYSEDFSLSVRRHYGVRTRAVQMNAKHLSFGDTSRDFYASLEYLRNKYKGKNFVGTCF